MEEHSCQRLRGELTRASSNDLADICDLMTGITCHRINGEWFETVANANNFS
jgi:hypothetical protein